jgi:signal transduction histidine kinase
MNATFEIAVANLKESIDAANATVDSGRLPTVRGYPLQLVELLQNLIGNGIKYRAAERLPVVSVTADRTNGEWTFTVHDNGLGIPPEAHAQVFEMFRRLHPQDEFPGTGIGLAICQKVVSRHGGRIWIESDGATGTAVKFTLPAMDDQ